MSRLEAVQTLSCEPDSQANSDQNRPNHSKYHVPISEIPGNRPRYSDMSRDHAGITDLYGNPAVKEEGR